MKRLIKHDNVIGTFLLSYIIVLSIPVIIGITLYTMTFHLLQQEVQRSNLMMLEQSKDILDRRLGELDDIVNQFALNEDVQKFLRIENILEDPKELLKLKKAQQVLRPYRVSNNFIEDILIHSRSGESLITPLYTDVRVDYFYGHLLAYENMDYDKWKETYLDSNYERTYIPATQVMVNKSTKSCITLIQTLPLGKVDKKGNMLIIFREEELKNLLTRLNHSKGGYAYIENSQGQLITSISSEGYPVEIVESKELKGQYTYRLNGEDMIVSHTISDYNGWRYVAVVPKTQILSQLSPLKYFSIITFIAVLVLGVGISYRLSVKNSKPIKEIIMTIKEFFNGDSGYEEETNKDIYTNIRGSLREILINNKDLKEQVNLQIPLVRRLFLQRLLNNAYKNKSEMEAYCSQLGDYSINKPIQVILVNMQDQLESNLQVEELTEQETLKIILLDMIGDKLPEVMFHYDVDLDTICLILQEGQNPEYIKTVLMTIHRDMSSMHGTYLRFAIGEMVSQLYEAVKSYEGARVALDYGVLNNHEPIIYRQDIQLSTEDFYYPLSIQEQLVNQVKAGQWEKVEDHLRDIYKQNREVRQVSSKQRQHLLYCMYGTIINLRDSLPFSEEINNQLEDFYTELKERGDFKRKFYMMSQIYKGLCGEIQRRKNQQSNQVWKDVLNFIEETYQDPQMCLTMVADHFNYSSNHISKMIKDNTGANFSTYLEKKRIMKACIYLKDPHNTVKDIAINMGYSNAQVFRRAFKRVMGVTPSNYSDRL